MPELGWKMGIVMMLCANLLSGQGVSLWDEEPAGLIRGKVFIDENGNGKYDLGEPLLEGIQINISSTSVDWTYIVSTSLDGSFSLPVGPGDWKAVLSTPGGFSVMNDSTREVVIGREGTIEAVMEFALTSTDMPAAMEAMEAEEAQSMPEPSVGSGDPDGSRAGGEQDFQEGDLREQEGGLRILDAESEPSGLTPTGPASSPPPLSLLGIVAVASVIVVILILFFMRRLIS
jgi:hypothetical protein